MRGGVVDDAGANRIPGAAIHHEAVAQGQDAARIVEAHLDLVNLVARMARTDQMLAAVLDPLHRPAEPARQERDQQVFRINVSLDPEAAADVERDAAHARLRKPQHRGGLTPHPVHHLGGRPDRHRIGARIVLTDHAAAFHRHGSVTVMVKAPLQAARCARERGVGIALADGERADEVGAETLMHDRRAGSERAFGIEHRR